MANDILSTEHPEISVVAIAAKFKDVTSSLSIIQLSWYKQRLQR
jgi:hypothetical protein